MIYSNRYLILGLISILTLVLYIFSISYVTGSTIYYTLFTVVSFFCISAGISQNKSFFYLALTCMLFLGFWMKHAIHLIFNYEYIEPIGLFLNTYESWNEVYFISIVGLISVILAKYIVLGKYKFFDYDSIISRKSCKKFKEISSLKIYFLWTAFLVVSFFILYININLGVSKLGTITNNTNLNWFARMFLILYTSLLLPIILFTFLKFTMYYKNKELLFTFLILLVAFLVSIVTQSRLVVLLYGSVFFFLLYKRIKFWKYILFIIFWIFTVYLSVVISSQIRTATYEKNQDLVVSINSNNVSLFKRLLLDRWIGLEGVMTTVSGDKQIANLFEEREFNKMDIYTKMAFASKLNNLEKENILKTQYATLPGIIGYFNLSGNIFLLILGVFFITKIIFFLEILILNVTKNMFISSFFGINLAFSIAGFGSDIFSWIKILSFQLVSIFLANYIFTNIIFKEK